MRYVEIIREAPASDGKYWFNVQNRKLLPLPGGVYHLDLVEDDPQAFGVDAQWLEDLRNNEPDIWHEHLMRAVLRGGWVRVGVEFADGREPYVSAGSLRDARACACELMRKGMIFDRLDIEIVPDRGWVTEGDFFEINDEAELSRFCRFGHVKGR